ncbi:MAG: molecular chaperone DnaK [Nitrospirales bacterium]|nr:MAG: molecular chaperone DnaK [Nitrospirales bacterium]
MNHTAIDIESIREKLVTLRDEISKIEGTGDDAAQTVELDQTKIGRVSRMDALQSQAMAKESQQRRQLRKQRIETALQRIEKDVFGLCVRCEEEIHPKRLAFDPTVLLCITCANQNET